MQKEYPNKITHLLNSPADVKAPHEPTPAFYGCYDWHSSVHGHWLLARVVREFPKAAFTTNGRRGIGKWKPDSRCPACPGLRPSVRSSRRPALHISRRLIRSRAGGNSMSPGRITGAALSLGDENPFTAREPTRVSIAAFKANAPMVASSAAVSLQHTTAHLVRRAASRTWTMSSSSESAPPSPTQRSRCEDVPYSPTAQYGHPERDRSRLSL